MSTREEKHFRGLGYLLSKVSGAFSAIINKLFGRWLSGNSGVSQDWVDDADWARIQQAPLRPRALLYAIFLVFIMLIVWAGLAPIDEIVRGQGTVIPSLQTQIVQSLDGGVIEEIRIREGQVVEKDQLLMRIDPTRFVSSFRENRVQYLSLLAGSRRLEALVNGTELEFPIEILDEMPSVAENERILYASNLDELTSQISIAGDQLAQRLAELNEVEAKISQSTDAFQSASRELEVTRPLLASGAVSEVEVLRLERDVSNARGERAQALAQKERISSSITEARNKQQEVELTVRNEWRSELSLALGQLSSLSESSLGLADRLKYAEIRSPVKGTVLRLFVNTIGGVAQPGREVVEITPLNDELLVEVKIAPKDIAFLRLGQRARVKLTAYDFTVYGGLLGEVEQIGVDTITDEKDETYYLVRVKTIASDFDEDLPIIPGMTAQVDIMSGKKTVLSYLLKPILRAKQNALTER